MQDSNFASFPWIQKRLGELEEPSWSLKLVLSCTSIVKMITRTRADSKFANTALKLRFNYLWFKAFSAAVRSIKLSVTKKIQLRIPLPSLFRTPHIKMQVRNCLENRPESLQPWRWAWVSCLWTTRLINYFQPHIFK